MDRYSAFAVTRVGELHLRNNIVCQDYSMAINNEDFVFSAVADGHGSQHYLRTDRGSRMAVESAFDCVSEFLDSIEDTQQFISNGAMRDMMLEELWFNIVTRWKARAESDFLNNPFTEEELSRIPDEYAEYHQYYADGQFLSAYGTTLAFVVCTDDFAFCGQIGDGKCVTVECSGIAADPVPDDPRCYNNITTSMCQEDAEYSARFVFFPKEFIPPAFFIGTDGIQNSYLDIEQLHGFYRGLALNFAEFGYNEGIHRLAGFLPEMTKMGSGDDVSCAGVIDIERLANSVNTLKSAVNFC